MKMREIDILGEDLSAPSFDGVAERVSEVVD